MIHWTRCVRGMEGALVAPWLVTLTERAIDVIDALALVIVAIGTVEAFVRFLAGFRSPRSGHDRRELSLRFGRWLVAALTFQLAADIIETSITTSWEAVGRLGAIAVIRTFLNYFLERDLSETRERERARQRQHEQAADTPHDPGIA